MPTVLARQPVADALEVLGPALAADRFHAQASRSDAPDE